MRAVLIPILLASMSQFGQISVSRHANMSGLRVDKAVRAETIKSTGAKMHVVFSLTRL